MKKCLSLLFSLYGSCLLAGCGAGNSTPPPITVSLSPNSALALDVNQSVSITANVTNDAGNQGFDWAITCGGGNCGTITAHTTSGAPATFTAPGAPPSGPVTITARLTGQTNSITTTAAVSPPPMVAMTGAITAASIGSLYSLQLMANGGVAPITWALGGGTSLPDTLSLSGTGMITGTPSGANGTFNFKVHVTDSGNPQVTSPDVQLSITVGGGPISVGLSPDLAFVIVNGSAKFVATVMNDQLKGNVNWTLTLNGMACTVSECGSVSPTTTATGAPTTYTAPASVPPANITLTATTVDGTPQAKASATVTVGATADNPVPLIYQPLSPSAVAPGAGGFPLTVNGTGFVPGSTVKWNGSAHATTFVGNSKLTATVLATDVAQFSTASVTVVNPPPGGGTSNVVFFETTRPTSSVALSARSELAAGTAPDAVAVGDFNGDGKLDLAVANSGSSNVSILLGNGDGTFQPAMDYGTGVGAVSVAVGDFNGDGKLDLATSNASSNNVSILLGNGDGTFRPTVNHNVGSSPSSVAVGDFNGDGKLDLAVANSASSDVSVLLGNGDGTFQAALNNGTGFGSSSVAVGDFNGDGRLDLAIANTSLSNVSILLGNGDGTFQPAVNYGAGVVPLSVAVGDFNGDGRLDLAVSNVPSGNTGPSNVSVLLGNGDGTFQPVVEYMAGSNTNFSSVAVGDFNGDDKLDLAVTNGGFGGNNNVSILLGNGDGTFQSPVEYAAGSNPYSVAVGDFNGDGRLDMAVADADSSAVSILLQPGLVSGPDAILSPASLTFATQLLNTTSPVQSVQLSNYGTTTLNIASIDVTTNYSETHTCGSSLAAGASCFISVTFTPTALGNLSGTLSITDDVPGSSQTVSLSGLGTEVALSPASLRFVCAWIPGPNGTFYFCSGPQPVIVTNVGTTALVINAITITGLFSQTNTCVANLGTGQSCTISVDWVHSGGSGGVLSIDDNGGASPQTVPLSTFHQGRR